ncbi:MAG: hypothetical protein ACRD5K_02970, partial [Candidatus Acidiferrales bacterium]
MKTAASVGAVLAAGSLSAWSKAPAPLQTVAMKGSTQQVHSLAKIRFSLATLPFRLDSDETLKFPHAPATM